MKDNDINYTIGGYSILEDVASGIISIVTGSVRFVIRLIKGTYEAIVDLKDKIVEIKPHMMPQRNSYRPQKGFGESPLVTIMKFRAGIF